MTTNTQPNTARRHAAARRRLAARGRGRARRGITLMEVLISIGIVLLGLAGVSALLPVGRYQIAEAAKSDRSAACGRAVLRDLQVRGLIDPATWCQSDGTPVLPIQANPGNPAALNAPLVIDPIGAANAIAGRFTFLDCTYMPYYPPLNWTLRIPAQRDALARLLCTWRDELEFDVPDDASVRPRRVFRMTDGDITTNAAAPPSPLAAGDSADNYSWLLTVSPSAAETLLPATQRRKFQVSVVVFHKRRLGAEHQFTISQPGFGGGDVLLQDPSPGVPADTPELGDIRPGEWIAVRRTGVAPFCLRWYRILAAPEPIGNSRRLTLAGPDWETLPSLVPTDAVYLPGVIGVYTENVEVQR